MFKYFDIQNSGKVDFDQFYRSMEKTGIIMEKSVSLTPTNSNPKTKIIQSIWSNTAILNKHERISDNCF